MGGAFGRYSLIFFLALSVRLLSWNSVFPGDETVWVGGPDAYYHARRAELAAAGAPLSNDLWLNYPQGETLHWPAVYDRMLGIVRKISSSRVVAFSPVLFGVLATLAFSLFAQRLLPDAWLPSSLAFAILPAVVYPSCLGAIDHHCVEALLVCTLAAALSTSSRSPVLAGIIAISSFGIIPMYPILLVLLVGSCILPRCRRASAATSVLLSAALAIPVAGRSYFADPWISRINEAEPLIRSEIDFFKAIVWLSPGFLFLPSACARWWRARSDMPAATALVATAVTLPLVLIQSRFTLYFALPCALALGETWRHASHLPRRLLRILALALLLPSAGGLHEMLSWREDPPRELRRAMSELSRITEPAGNPMDPEARPDYGVVAAWDLGNQILSIGERPVLADAFHTGSSGRDLAHRILLSAPIEATRVADEQNARVLFLTDIASNGYAREYRNTDQPIPYHSLFGQLFILQRTDLGWERIHSSDERIAFELWNVPAVQIWRRK
ncbi:MAG: hypothetical protein AAB229_10390 [Candidatus Hydrogenedentota bacterium]